MAAGRVAAGEAAAPSGALRVLVVEDEMMIALLVQDLLTGFGFEVAGPVARLDAALELARRERLDLALLDVNIKGGAVYPVAAALAARGIPFIFVTGYGKTGLDAAYRDCPTVQKPYDAPTLRAAIAAACGWRE